MLTKTPYWVERGFTQGSRLAVANTQTLFIKWILGLQPTTTLNTLESVATAIIPTVWETTKAETPAFLMKGEFVAFALFPTAKVLFTVLKVVFCKKMAKAT